MRNIVLVTLAGIVAADLLPFRVTSWGSGGGIGMQLAATRRFETVGAGLSVGCMVASGAFSPLSVRLRRLGIRPSAIKPSAMSHVAPSTPIRKTRELGVAAGPAGSSLQARMNRQAQRSVRL